MGRFNLRINNSIFDMVCLDLSSQLVFVVTGVAAFLVLNATGAFNLWFFRHFSHIYNCYGTRIYMVFNIFGLLTTNLLEMSYVHVVELTPLLLVFLHEFFYDRLPLPERLHHILSIVGLALQLHIGVGGALMSYLLLDELTDYVHDPRSFWIAFVVLRIVGYNVVLALAVKQGVAQAAASVGVKFWVASVVVWWIFSAFYHIHWIWTERAAVADAFAPKKCTSDPTALRQPFSLSSRPADAPPVPIAEIW
jgi:hypothetical protein